MIKISVYAIKITFLAGVICSNFIGLAFAQTPGLLGPGSVAPITDSGIAPVTGATATNPVIKKPYNWYAVPGMGKSNEDSALLFYSGYYSNKMSPISEVTNQVTVGLECQITVPMDNDDYYKIKACNSLPVPYNLICAAEIVRKKLAADGANNVCRHHTASMLDAIEFLDSSYIATYEGGWQSGDNLTSAGWVGHNWVEVVADGKRYLIDAYNQEYYSMDGPVEPYCGNGAIEKGEECDGSNKGCGEGQKCESCKCTGEVVADGYIINNSKSKYVLGGLAAAAVILLSQDSSSNSNDTETGTANTPETTEPETGTETEQPTEVAPEPIGDSRDGNYNVATSVVSNPANHPVLIQNLLLQLRIVGAVLTITQLSNNSNFPRQLNATLSGAAFNALTNGNYAGFNTIFQIVGTINALNQLSFQIIVGGNGSLPTGQPITYNAQGSK
ncbi:MAG: hypothetical protein ACN4GR_11190 [Arenicellales bacterium]